MNRYTNFASVYDTFMDNIPYEEWCDFVAEKLCLYNINKGIVVELGSGTGNFSTLLCDKGYKVYGIDNSYSMLAVALDKLVPKYYDRIRYSLQDMRDFKLPRPVKAIVSVCDSMNYITSVEDLYTVFNNVYNNLSDDGLFIFDIKTIHFFRNILGDDIIADTYEDSSFIWENNYDEDTSINTYTLNIFTKYKKNLYKKNTETHYQRGYELSRIEAALEECGFHVLEVVDELTKASPSSDSERVFFISKKD